MITHQVVHAVHVAHAAHAVAVADVAEEVQINMEPKEVNELEVKKLIAKIKPKHVLQWHITHQCNLRCKHCYQDDYSKDLDIEELEKILYQYIDFLKEYKYTGHINFTGGEPLLYNKIDKLFKLFEICDKHNITYGILTNGTMITEDLVKKLSKLNGIRFVQMSLEGTKEINDMIRGNGNYDKVMKAVKLLNKEYIQTMISFTIHEGNYKELRKLIWCCRLHGVKRFWTDRLVPIGGVEKYKENGIELITTEHYQEVLKILGQEHKLNWIGTRVHANRALQFMSGCGEFYECSAGKRLLTILADGTLLPCRRLPIELGNITTENLIDIMKNNKIIKELNGNIMTYECNNCHLNTFCKGGAKCLSYAVYGNFRQKDINCPL